MDSSTQTSTWLLDQLVDDAVHLEKTQNGPIPRGHGKHHSPHKTKKVKKKPIPWSRLHPLQKSFKVLGVVIRMVLLFVVLYFFICSLGLLEDAFKLLGGRAAGEAFRNSALLSNPIAGLMIGILATVLVQSSSTATSIVVAMVASQVIPLRQAIPIIMGTNVGTSITSTLVSLAQAAERTEFRRAFAGATVHDMFNWSAVIVLLPLEVASGYLYQLTKVIVRSMNIHGKDYQVELLTAITGPFTELIVQINRDVITDIAMAPNKTAESTVMKRFCSVTMIQEKVTVFRYQPVQVACNNVDRDNPFYASCTSFKSHFTPQEQTAADLFLGQNDTQIVNKTLQRSRCHHLFALTNLSDTASGAILLIVSIVIILGSLFAIVKILNSLLQGPVANVIQKTVNADFPGKLAFLTGYLAILVGCGMTIIIQSSSVFTSTLTPLVGVGIVKLERMYPMTLGSNIGTTVTGILAAISTRGPHLDQALQIALCHLFFNISALLLFYPIPFMRFPISFAKILGKITSKYRWFAGLYLVGMFVILPGLVFSLSFAGIAYLAGIGGPLFLGFVVVTVINVLQVKRPNWLPHKLRSWDFLPLFCHSWKPYDRILSCRCFKDKCPHCFVKHEQEEESDEEFHVDDDDDQVFALSPMHRNADGRIYIPVSGDGKREPEFV